MWFAYFTASSRIGVDPIILVSSGTCVDLFIRAEVGDTLLRALRENMWKSLTAHMNSIGILIENPSDRLVVPEETPLRICLNF